MGALRKFLIGCSGAVALSFAACGSAGAIAQLPGTDPYTSGLVRDAHDLADHIHGHHYDDGEPSTLRDHCEAEDLYDKLSASYDAAIASGNLIAAAKIGGALGDLGDELGYDHYLADKYYGGYDWCFCLVFDDIVGPHSAFVEIQYGLSNLQPGVEDFTGNKRSGIFGVSAGMIFPATQNGAYGIAKFSVFDLSSGRTDLFAPNSGSSIKTNWLITADGGLGIPLIKSIGLDARASLGLALGDEQVTIPAGTDKKWALGFTADAGLSWKFARRWTFDIDYRYVDLRDRRFTPASGVTFEVDQKMHMFMVGARYQLGSTP